MVEIHEITAEETYLIRKEVLRKNMDLPFQFSGDHDKDTFHLGLFESKKLISVVSFMKTNNHLFLKDQYQLRGMATLECFQRKGYGKMLISRAEKILKKNKVKEVWCNSRIVALDFYTEQGFQIIGEEFQISQIGGHFMMNKKILY